MVCQKCRCEMRIVNSFAQIRGRSVYIVHDLKCQNPMCEDGARKLPSARVTNLWSAPSDPNGVYCCGAVLAYVGQSEYSVPDASLVLECNEHTLSLACPTCGETQTLDISGKTRTE